jgi:biotin operon repressor
VPGTRVKVTVDVGRLHYSLSRLLGFEFVGVRELAILLGIDRRAAGRILAAMTQKGFAVKWSRAYYRLIALDPPNLQETSQSIEKSESPDWYHDTVECGGESSACNKT